MRLYTHPLLPRVWVVEDAEGALYAVGDVASPALYAARKRVPRASAGSRVNVREMAAALGPQRSGRGTTVCGDCGRGDKPYRYDVCYDCSQEA